MDESETSSCGIWLQRTTCLLLVVDVDPDAVEQLTEHGADGAVADLSDADTVSKAVVDADPVVRAVPGFMGYETVQRVLQEGRPVVNISFFREDAFGLDELGKPAGTCRSPSESTSCGYIPGAGTLNTGKRPCSICGSRIAHATKPSSERGSSSVNARRPNGWSTETYAVPAGSVSIAATHSP